MLAAPWTLTVLESHVNAMYVGVFAEVVLRYVGHGAAGCVTDVVWC